MLFYRVTPIIVSVNRITREGVKEMQDFLRDLAVTILGVIAAKALDEGIEAIKRKTSPQPGKHAKRS